MSQLRIVRPPQRQLTLDELTFVPRAPVLTLVEEALPLARQLAVMATAMGPASEEVARELIELLSDQSPHRPRRAA